MEQRNRHDRLIGDSFAAARRVDRAAAPEFAETLAQARAANTGRRPRYFRTALVTSAAGLGIAFASFWGVARISDIPEVAAQGPGPEVRRVASNMEANTPAVREVPDVLLDSGKNKLPADDKAAPPAARPDARELSAAEVGRLASLGYVVGKPQSGEKPLQLELVESFEATRSVRALTASVGTRSRTTPVGGVLFREALQQYEAERLPAPEQTAGAEAYDLIEERGFVDVIDHPLSTFSIDVDTASYSNVRRFLNQGQLPPADAVRIEELINYFSYDYPPPSGTEPFSSTVEIADCPWNPDHRLARIGLQGRHVSRGEHRGSNLVFLLDVSGSMRHERKLPLVREALTLLVGQLDGRDQVAIVVYAGASGLVLPSTSGADSASIVDALRDLQAGGSTNGGEGLRLAYKVARDNFIEGGINRVILATDGDFNLGVTSRHELLDLIRQDAQGGIFLTALGFGMGNYKDATLETLADKGNGNYAYIDNLNEARKVLVEELAGTLITIAKDVKIQVEFNPAEVAAYRLIGYENRMLRKEDFNDDRKDAGEIGAGHSVTALYEIVPPGARQVDRPAVDPLRYQEPTRSSDASSSGELFTLKLRYKEPDGRTSQLVTFPVVDEGRGLQAASDDFRFAASVAAFGMCLRQSEHRAGIELPAVRELAQSGAVDDPTGRRAEFLTLVDLAMTLGRSSSTQD